MISYETLDALADAYTPLLAIISFGLVGFGLWKTEWKLSLLRSLSLVWIAMIAYGFMMLDNHFQIWSFFSIDYSTHTAVSLGLVLFLFINIRRFAIAWVVSFIGYLLLMLYQQYHTIADILTTGVPVGLLIGGGIAWLMKHYVNDRILGKSDSLHL